MNTSQGTGGIVLNTLRAVKGHLDDGNELALEVMGGTRRLPGSSWNFDGDPTGIVMVRR